MSGQKRKKGHKHRANAAPVLGLTYEQATARAERNGGVVCGVRDATGKSRYWVMPDQATSDEVARHAFRYLHGRWPNEDEMAIWRMDPRREKD